MRIGKLWNSVHKWTWPRYLIGEMPWIVETLNSRGMLWDRISWAKKLAPLFLWSRYWFAWRARICRTQEEFGCIFLLFLSCSYDLSRLWKSAFRTLFWPLRALRIMMTSVYYSPSGVTIFLSKKLGIFDWSLVQGKELRSFATSIRITVNIVIDRIDRLNSCSPYIEVELVWVQSLSFCFSSSLSSEFLLSE